MARPPLPADFTELGTWGPIIRSAIWDTSDRADGRLPATSQSASSYTLTVPNAGTTVYRNLGTANTVTVPANVFTAEDRILVRQEGAGVTSIAAGTGMVLTAVGKTGSGPFALAGAGAIVEIVIRTPTTGFVDGALA